MGLLDKIAKKKTKLENKPRILTVNPYLESKQLAMELISTLSSTVSNYNIPTLFSEALSIIQDDNREDDTLTLKDFFNLYGHLESYFLFKENFRNQLSLMEIKEESNSVNIAVAGGFSAGKSSFLNCISGKKDFLPTGIDPTSVIPTYIYCNSTIQDNISAITMQGGMVTLNNQILSVLGHQFQKRHNAKLSTLIKQLSIQIHCPQLSGFCFIDTPGYDRAEDRAVVGKTDRDTALKEIQSSDVLFWVVDTERGAISQNDKKMILEQFSKDKPKLIIFNKSDKKPKSEIVEVINKAAVTLKAEENASIIDIIAFSSFENGLTYSFRGNSLDDIFKLIHKKSNNDSRVLERLISQYTEPILNDIDLLIKDEIPDTIDILEKDILEKKKEVICSPLNGTANSLKEINKEVNKEIKNLNNRYDRLSSNWNKMYQLAGDGIDREYKWLDASGVFSTTSHLESALSKSLKKFNDAVGEYNRLQKDISNARFVDLKISNEIIKDVEEIDEILRQELNDTSFESKMIAEEKEKLNNEEQNRKEFIYLVEELNDSIMDSYRKYDSIKRVAPVIEMSNKTTCPFTAVDKDNLEQFIQCFANGYDLKKCNKEGYNILNYTVRSGNNDMVSFLLSQSMINAAEKDKRGYNAFHTAIENQYKDMVELLLEKDRALLWTTSDSGKDISTIVKENKSHFSVWFDQKIKMYNN